MLSSRRRTVLLVEVTLTLAYMVYLPLAALLYSLAYVQGASPKLTVPDPIYYVNDSIKIFCGSVISGDIISVDIIINNTDIKYSIACRRLGNAARWGDPEITGMISGSCEDLPNSGNVTLGINAVIVDRMRSSTVTCKLSYYEGGLKTVYDIKTNVFSDAYVEPARLEFDRFEFDDEMPILNKRTRARCVSYGGHPTSEFLYEVRSKSDAIVYSITELKDGAAEFTVNDQLKNGFKVTCRDKVHTRRSISLTKQNCSGTVSEICMPHYITSKVPSSSNVSFNPSYSNSVACDVEGYPSDKIIYTWTIDGKVLPFATTATYIIPADIQKEGKTEILSCTVTHDTYGTVNITWTITWSMQATITTKPSSTSLAIGVGAGVGLGVIIIAVVLGVILYKKKKDNSERYQSTPSAPNSVAVKRRKKSAKKSRPQTNNEM